MRIQRNFDKKIKFSVTILYGFYEKIVLIAVLSNSSIKNKSCFSRDTMFWSEHSFSQIVNCPRVCHLFATWWPVSPERVILAIEG